jgi:hypothetical protein
MWLLLAGCFAPPETAGDRSAAPVDTSEPADTDSRTDSGLGSDSGDSGAPAETAAVTLLSGASCTNPCTFSASVVGDVAKLRYEADEWAIGEATPAQPEITYTFSEVGDRLLRVVALDEAGETLATDEAVVRVESAPAADALGVWLWYIEGTGMDHSELATRLAALGVARIYVKVADGDASCSAWPELCDASVPRIYAAAGIEAWAWAYVYPGSPSKQAEALTLAARAGYDGYVLDIETEFDGTVSSLEDAVSAFADARDAAVTAGTIPAGWELRATTWGNPGDHGMRVDIIDRYVDAHMPQTYVEAWGASYMADAAHWVQVGTCEYRELGATQPVHHIVSMEYGDITVRQVESFIAASGPETSVWRVPGGSTPASIWDDWAAIDWAPGVYDTPDCP